MVISSEKVVVKYLSNVNINVSEVIYIDGDKLKEIEKQVQHLFNQNAMTTADIINVCESLKTTWMIRAALDLAQELFGLKKVEP